MPAQWPSPGNSSPGSGFGMDTGGMRQAIELAEDMRERVLTLLTDSTDDAQPLWPAGPPAEEYASTQYCDWRDGGIQSSAATYRSHLESQRDYLAQLIEKLQGSLQGSEELEDQGEQKFGNVATDLA